MKDFMQLTRFYLSLAVSLSGLFTYLAISQNPSFAIVVPVFGILFLALGSSALNQIQEQKLDAKMQRTSSRPLVNGNYTWKQALIITIGLLFLSFLCLHKTMGQVGTFFFVATIILYNFIYTPLKPKTHYALIIGSFLGVIAPSIAWLYARESLLDIRFIYLFCLFFIWQVPHFWLLALMYSDDYKKAGFPTLVDKLGKQNLLRVSSVWYLFCVFIGLLLVNSFYIPPALWTIVIVGSGYVFYSGLQLLFRTDIVFSVMRSAFIKLNIYIFFILLTLIINNLYFGTRLVIPL